MITIRLGPLWASFNQYQSSSQYTFANPLTANVLNVSNEIPVANNFLRALEEHYLSALQGDWETVYRKYLDIPVDNSNQELREGFGVVVAFEVPGIGLGRLIIE